MTKYPATMVTPMSVVIILSLFLQHVNTGAIIVQSSSSSTNCNGMNCPAGSSCSVSFSSTGENSTSIKACTDFEGNSHREKIVTTLVGNEECITNITDVNGNVTTTKNCNQLSAQELEQRQEEWEKQLNVVTASGEKLNTLLDSEQRAWEMQQEAMDRAFEARERALERAMQQRERMWKMQQKAIDRQLQKLTTFWM